MKNKINIEDAWIYKVSRGGGESTILHLAGYRPSKKGDGIGVYCEVDVTLKEGAISVSRIAEDGMEAEIERTKQQKRREENLRQACAHAYNLSVKS
jgi:post-segregation antitoxin (ccd killing protein)